MFAFFLSGANKVDSHIKELFLISELGQYSMIHGAHRTALRGRSDDESDLRRTKYAFSIPSIGVFSVDLLQTCQLHFIRAKLHGKAAKPKAAGSGKSDFKNVLYKPLSTPVSQADEDATATHSTHRRHGHGPPGRCTFTPTAAAAGRIVNNQGRNAS